MKRKKMKKSEKNSKKGVDKRLVMCYYNQALAREGHERGPSESKNLENDTERIEEKRQLILK